MGCSKKHQVNGDSLEDKKWVIAGITIGGPLRSISTKMAKDEDDEHSISGSTTPTGKESRIPEIPPCPSPPRKRRPASTCHKNGNREFFTSPDLDSFFKLIPNSERAN